MLNKLGNYDYSNPKPHNRPLGAKRRLASGAVSLQAPGLVLRSSFMKAHKTYQSSPQRWRQSIEGVGSGLQVAPSGVAVCARLRRSVGHLESPLELVLDGTPF